MAILVANQLVNSLLDNVVKGYAACDEALNVRKGICSTLDDYSSK